MAIKNICVTGLTVMLCLLLPIQHSLAAGWPLQVSLAASQTLAVLNLEALAGVSQGEAQLLSERLRAWMVQSGRYQIMERQKMEAILKEQGFSQSAMVCQDASCSLELGKLLAVRQLATGSVSRVGSMYSLTVRILDVEKGQILVEKFIDCDCTLQQMLVQEVPQLVRQLLGESVTLPAQTWQTTDSKQLQTLYQSQEASPLLAGSLNLIPGLGLGFWSLGEWGYALLEYLAVAAVAGVYTYRLNSEPKLDNPDEITNITLGMFGAVHLAAFGMGIMLANQHNQELRQRLGLTDPDLHSWQPETPGWSLHPGPITGLNYQFRF